MNLNRTILVLFFSLLFINCFSEENDFNYKTLYLKNNIDKSLNINNDKLYYSIITTTGIICFNILIYNLQKNEDDKYYFYGTLPLNTIYITWQINLWKRN